MYISIQWPSIVTEKVSSLFSPSACTERKQTKRQAQKHVHCQINRPITVETLMPVYVTFVSLNHFEKISKRWHLFFFTLKVKAPYRMKVVDSALKVAHEAVYVSYGSVGGGMLGD